MQRGVVEVVLRAGAQWLRIATTHLEYYSTAQRIAQVHALRTLHLEASAHAAAPRRDAGEAGTPFAPTPRPASALLCGDFNFRPDSIEHALLTAPMDAGAPPLVDAWRTRHPGVPHPATFCVHDAGCTAYCCDFVFASVDLAQRVTAVTVDGDCRASDHQPVLLELEA
jgi:endonuclease/exonuclease/phosphatase family metal-dependent hydrolase